MPFATSTNPSRAVVRSVFLVLRQPLTASLHLPKGSASASRQVIRPTFSLKRKIERIRPKVVGSSSDATETIKKPIPNGYRFFMARRTEKDIKVETNQKHIFVNRSFPCHQMHFVQHKPSSYYFSKHVLPIATT